MLQERLAQIEARKKEMRSLLDVEGTDLKVLNDELDTLKTEEKEIRQKIKLAEELKEDPKNIIVEERSEKKVENINILSTAEYRSGYLKNLMGQKLNEVEERALTTGASSAGGAVPTQTMNSIIDKLKQTSVLFNRISVSYIAGNVSFVVANAKNDAAFKTEGEDGTPKDDTVTTVNLAGYELIKLVELSAATKAMTIDAFEAYIVAEIGRKMAIAIENAILNGTGSGQPTGLLAASQITATGTFAKAGMTYKDLVGLLAKLPTMYHANADLIMPRELFFNDIIGMTTQSGEPVVVQNPQEPMKFNVLGYPVIIDDYMPTDTIVFGDLSYYKMNFSQNPAIEADRSVGFKSGKTTYRGLAVVDGKPALAEAFVKYTRASS